MNEKEQVQKNIEYKKVFYFLYHLYQYLIVLSEQDYILLVLKVFS